MAAGQRSRTRGHSFFHVGIKRSNSVGVGQWTELCTLLERISHAQLLHAFDELALELVGNFLRHDKARGRDARLTVVLTPRVYTSCAPRFQIDAPHPDERTAAPRFEPNFLD